ncbi:MAG TPA: polysaccharide deacetylase family protein [Chloroflexota bacterium]|nr:polysaccharide deacetylase family protein [Chloroflexota bacterium]
MRAALLVLLLALSPAAANVRIVSVGSTHSHVVALTFDAGADRGYAARILQILERNHIHATFGMTGVWAKANGDLVRRMIRDGDVLVNHTYDHRSFTGYSTKTAALTRQQRTWEITQADRVIRSEVGRNAKPYFRPPYGDYDQATLTLLLSLGYRYMVMWTVDSLGWEGLSAPAIIQRCMSLLRPGAIYLMHVGIQSQDAAALPSFLTALKRAGYREVTVPQLIALH